LVAVDKDGGRSGFNTRQTNIQTSRFNGGDFILGGTPAFDTFTFSRQGDGSILVRRNSDVATAVSNGAFIRVFGGDGSDTFSVSASPNLGIQLDGQAGSDQYRVDFGLLFGNVTVADTGPLPPPDRSTNMDTLTVNGTSGFDYIIKKNGTVTRVSNSAEKPVSYTGMEMVNISGGQGNDTIADPESENVNLFGDEGDDVILIADTTGPVTADGGEGANVYVITMGNLAGPVTIDGTAGTSTLTVIAPPGTNTLTLSDTGLTGVGETINLNLGSTAAGITVDGSAGTNNLLIQGAPPAPVTVTNVTVISPSVGTIVAPIDPRSCWHRYHCRRELHRRGRHGYAHRRVGLG
jgi:hypothetical protein